MTRTGLTHDRPIGLPIGLPLAILDDLGEDLTRQDLIALLTYLHTLDSHAFAGALAYARFLRDARSRGICKSVENEPLVMLVTAAPGPALTVARLTLGGVMGLEPAAREMLLTTLRTWFQVGGRTSEAARLLYCNRNTVRNRLIRVEQLSGRYLRDPQGLAELLVAAETLQLLEPDSRPWTASPCPPEPR